MASVATSPISSTLTTTDEPGAACGNQSAHDHSSARASDDHELPVRGPVGRDELHDDRPCQRGRRVEIAVHTEHTSGWQIERHGDVGELLAPLDGDEQVGREGASFVATDRCHPPHRPLSECDAQPTASPLPHPAFPPGDVRGVRADHGLHHRAVGHPMAPVRFDVRSIQCGDERVDLTSMECGGTARAPPGADRTDRPRGE